MKTRSGTLVDGSHHPGPGTLYPHLLPGKNGTQTRRVSVLIANHQPIGVTQTKRANALIEDRYTCPTPHLHMHSHCTVQTTCVPWLKGLQSSRRVVCQKHSLIHASCFILRLSTLNTSTGSLSPTSPVLLSSTSLTADLLCTHPFIHCEDPRRDGTSTEFHSSTV